MTKPDRMDVHQAVTDQIVAMIEAGTDDVRLPWLRTGMSSIIPKNAASGDSYNGINIHNEKTPVPYPRGFLFSTNVSLSYDLICLPFPGTRPIYPRMRLNRRRIDPKCFGRDDANQRC